MVFARDLQENLAADLAYRIQNQLPWPELSSLIEQHEGKPFSYLFKNNGLRGSTFRIDLTVSIKV